MVHKRIRFNLQKHLARWRRPKKREVFDREKNFKIVRWPAYQATYLCRSGASVGWSKWSAHAVNGRIRTGTRIEEGISDECREYLLPNEGTRARRMLVSSISRKEEKLLIQLGQPEFANGHQQDAPHFTWILSPQ